MDTSVNYSTPSSFSEPPTTLFPIMYSNTSRSSSGHPGDATATDSSGSDLLAPDRDDTGGRVAVGSSAGAHQDSDEDCKRKPMDDASLSTNDYYTEDCDEEGEEEETGQSNKSSAPQSAEEWNANFEVLRKFYTDYGHCNVPFSSAWSDLANWLDGQNRRHAYLKPDQLARLAALGALKHRGRQVRHARWDQRYEELVEFKKQHGHCHIPRNNPEFKSLLNWLLKSRQCRYKSCGTNKQLTESQIDKLIAIGALEAEGGQTVNQLQQETTNFRRQTWDEHFNALKAFRSQFGHCKVPANEAKWESLSQWLQTQKQSYHKKLLSMYQLRKLEAAGVVQIHHQDQSARSGVNAATKSDGKSNENTPQSAGNSPLLKDASSNAAATSVLPAAAHNDDDNDGAAPISGKRIRTAEGCCDGDWFACRVHVILSDWSTREIGFILLSSRASSTLADARRKILDTLILDPGLQGEDDFEFYLPLGPITKRQESSVGPMFNFLKYYDPSRGFSKEGDAQLFLVKRSEE